LIVYIVSAGLLILGAIFWQRGNHLLKNGKPVQAIVFSNEIDTDSDGLNTYYPVVRFLTDKQEWITQKLNIGYSPKKREGTKLQVICDPENPTDVQINSMLVLKILPIAGMVVGVIGIMFASLEYVGVIDVMPTVTNSETSL